MVQDLYQSGNYAAISDYCKCDVLDTYFVFLRMSVVLGKLSLEKEQEIVRDTKYWLEELALNSTVYRDYLNHWGRWEDPWTSEIKHV